MPEFLREKMWKCKKRLKNSGFLYFSFKESQRYLNPDFQFCNDYKQSRLKKLQNDFGSGRTLATWEEKPLVPALRGEGLG
jgi:hypothetical protein